MSVGLSERLVHIMYSGESHDIPQSSLDIGDASTDDQVKAAVATYFNIPLDKLRFYVVDRSPDSSNLTVRPQAVFG